jgi:hypothetical protein
MWLNIFQIVLQLCVILLFYRQGFTMMVAAYSLFNILWLSAWQPFARRIIGLRAIDLLGDTLPFGAVAAAVMTATYWLTLAVANLWLLLLLRIAIAAALYYAAMRLLNVAILRECLQFIRKK